MNLQTITVDQNIAREKFLEYRRAVHANRTKEDEILMRSYRALSQGKRIINLRETVLAGGFDELGRPLLAVARADATRIFFERGNRALKFYEAKHRFSFRNLKGMYSFQSESLPVTYSSREYWAIVPIIPPALRPNDKLENYTILFEAAWQKAPVDPALLKKLTDDLYVVVAVWDLTELERKVLEITR